MKVGIITIPDDGGNYGSRLQNYAVIKLLEKWGISPYNFAIYDKRKKTYLFQTQKLSNRIIKLLLPTSILNKRRLPKQDELTEVKRERFEIFNKQFIKGEKIVLKDFSNIKTYIDERKFDYFIVGSDQVWNPIFAGSDFYFLNFANEDKRIAFSASIGYENLSTRVTKQYSKYWKKMKYISVREESAASFIEDTIGKRPDVFVDPTLMLSQDEWSTICRKPETDVPEKFILGLFLGDIPDEFIKNCKQKYEFEIILLNNKQNNKYYSVDPTEFIYLIKKAELVLTDSFHCTVFSIIFHKQFWVFERIEKNEKKMFTRIESLLNKFELQDRVQDRNKRILDNQIEEERFVMVDEILKSEQVRVTEKMCEVFQLEREGC